VAIRRRSVTKEKIPEGTNHATHRAIVESQRQARSVDTGDIRVLVVDADPVVSDASAYLENRGRPCEVGWRATA